MAMLMMMKMKRKIIMMMVMATRMTTVRIASMLEMKLMNILLRSV